MTRITHLALAAVPFLLSVACTNPDRLPAETALKAAEGAAATLTADVAKYAPEPVKAFQDGLASAKAAAAKQDFKAARAAAEPLAAKAKEAVAAANAKMAELKKAADEAVAQLSEKVAALQARVAELTKSRKLPKGIAKDAVAKAKEAVTALEAGVASAKEQARSDAAAAVVTVKGLAAKASETASSLKM